MTSLSTNHLAFPGNSSPLTERRITAQAQAWANALRPYLRYVNIVEHDSGVKVVAESGNDLIITLGLSPSGERRGRWPLWTMETYSRRSHAAHSYDVGNLQDVLVSLLHEL